jgi:hypothetical protein
MDYFYHAGPLFSEYIFWRRFWISKILILPILGAVRDIHTSNTRWMPPVSLPSLLTKKWFATVLMFAYGVVGVLVDEYVRISETTCVESMYKFCKEVV